MPIYFAWFTTALLSVGGDANDQNLPQSGRLLYCVIIPLPTFIRRRHHFPDGRFVSSDDNPCSRHLSERQCLKTALIFQEPLRFASIISRTRCRMAFL